MAHMPPDDSTTGLDCCLWSFSALGDQRAEILPVQRPPTLAVGADVVRFSGRSANHTVEPRTRRARAKYVVKKGKTPVWSREDAKTLLDSIPKDSVSGLRDLALIAAMFYSFARVSAVLKLRVDDYYHNGARRRLRLHEKGGNEHEMPVHHLLEEILDEYIVAAGLQSGQPLFQSVNSLGTAVTGQALNRYNAWAAIRKRAKAAGFFTPVGCHTWRATGITIYLENDGRLEHAQQMAGHESPRTTKLYDRTKDENYTE